MLCETERGFSWQNWIKISKSSQIWTEVHRTTLWSGGTTAPELSEGESSRLFGGHIYVYHNQIYSFEVVRLLLPGQCPSPAVVFCYLSLLCTFLGTVSGLMRDKVLKKVLKIIQQTYLSLKLNKLCHKALEINYATRHSWMQITWVTNMKKKEGNKPKQQQQQKTKKSVVLVVCG